MKYCVAANMAGSPTTPVPLSGDFCEQMRKAHEMGYDAIEIHVPDVSVLDIPAIQACMRETGMEVATLGRARSTADMGFICAMQMSKGSRNCLSGCARLSTVRRS